MATGLFLTHSGCLTPLAKKTKAVLANVRNVQSTRVGERSSQTINKSLKIILTALHLAHEVIELFGEFGLCPDELFNLTWQSIDWELGQEENKGAIRRGAKTRERG